MCVCVVCHLLFTFFLLTCSTPLWWEDLVRAPFVSHQNFVDLHLRSNFFFFFCQVYVRHKPLFFFAWNFSDLVWSLGALQEGKIDSYRTVSIVCWLAWKNPVANDLIDYANRVFNHVLLFPPFFSKGLPAAYAAAYAGRGYPGYASFGLPYPAGKSNR